LGLGVAEGLSYLITGGHDIPSVPNALVNSIGTGGLGGVQWLIIISFVATLLFGLILALTRFGRYTYAIGSNPEAALRAGINVDRHLIKGGAGIARFRGTPQPSDHSPEDWVGSATSLFSRPGVGLTRLASGETLRDAIAAAPAEFLGPAHVARYGAGEARPDAAARPGIRRLLPQRADPFFIAELVTGSGPVTFTPGYAILIVVAGDGELGYGSGRLAVRPGTTVLVPYAAGPTTLNGGLRALRCLPPI
jgi:hypothetical protein